MAVLPSAFVLHLANLAQIQAALQRAHAKDEQNAVEMVDLVLKGARKQFFAVHLEPLAVFILGADADLGRARHLLANIGKTQAALLLVLLALAEDDLRD